MVCIDINSFCNLQRPLLRGVDQRKSKIKVGKPAIPHLVAMGWISLCLFSNILKKEAGTFKGFSHSVPTQISCLINLPFKLY